MLFILIFQSLGITVGILKNIASYKTLDSSVTNKSAADKQVNISDFGGKIVTSLYLFFDIFALFFILLS